jgi:pantoate--beta-alanine ligase
MLIIKTNQDIRYQIVKSQKEGLKVGFVPTMGALHAGHISLINRSKRENGRTVCSIFVNPTQFNDPKDFEKYPVTLDSDIEKLKKAKCDILFLPSVAEMYPDGYGHSDKIDFGYISCTLEGEFRPGHFDGMAQIVEKLLRAVTPDCLYMGQKDYQQALICGMLISKRKLKTALINCPIKREKDGLAMSSRNLRLDAHSRHQATEIVKTLRYIKRKTDQNHGQWTSTDIENQARERLAAYPDFKVEYIAIRDAKTLRPVKNLSADTSTVALIAAWIGGVRLIDNMLL